MGSSSLQRSSRIPRRLIASRKFENHPRESALSCLGFVSTAALLFGSGTCALIYQTAWLRELRLVFGASTQATAAVLAIFMGGLGAGSVWFGRQVDRHPRPLRFYGLLELGTALGAAVTPMLLLLVRGIYFASGGTAAIGPILAPLVQLLLAAVVLGVPALLMGGTLPAAARAVEKATDLGRRRIALVYGANTLGAVGGALLATFALMEHLGARGTILVAASINVVVGLLALALAGKTPATGPDLEAAPLRASDARPSTTEDSVPRSLVLGAACLVGFVFFLMEIVWYRMLGPLLGGTTFAFGLILAMALFGIGLGSTLYALGGRQRRPTLALLATTCAMEALGLAIPFALGDRIAVLGLLLRPLGQFNFGELVAGWGVLASLVVMPAAIFAGFQFPILLALLGRGRKNLGRDTGWAYAFNTTGAIAGSLAAGFGLLPLLTAPGVWRLCTVALGALSMAALMVDGRHRRRGWTLVAAPVCAACALLLVALPAGPTAAWRHSGIGAGRVNMQLNNRNDLITFLGKYRRSLGWEADGRESSVGILTDNGISLIVNGKSDGNTVEDAGTQVMLGLLGAFLHPEPHRALVIGLGTGTSAGWLAQVSTISRVDVVELESSIVSVARRCAAANHDVTSNPKVHIRIADGREFLLTNRERYDLIASEPSNPYRAGVSSLYTREFYQAARERLAGGGLFLQWVQAYEIDVPTLRTVYATMQTVFPYVETWATQRNDLVLVGSQEPLMRAIPALRRRVAQEPFRSALRAAWRTVDLEGVLAHFVGNDRFGSFVARSVPPNTDDNMVLEYGFARTLGRVGGVKMADLEDLAIENQQFLPHWIGRDLDIGRSVGERAASSIAEGLSPSLPPPGNPFFPRVVMMRAFLNGDYEEAHRALQEVRGGPYNLTDLAMIGEFLADAGDPAAQKSIDGLRPVRPAEADFLLARLSERRGDLAQATAAYEGACESYRQDPWTWPLLAARELGVAEEIAGADSSGRLSQRLFVALGTPFAAYSSNLRRLIVRVHVAERLDGTYPGRSTREAFEVFGDKVPWQEELLAARAACYENLGDPRAGPAAKDLRRFRANKPPGPTTPTAVATPHGAGAR